MLGNKSSSPSAETLTLEDLIGQQASYVDTVLSKTGGEELYPWKPWEKEFQKSTVQTEHTTDAMLKLILKWPEWMKRRVEHIQINSQSQTRRKLTFDFRLLPDCELPYPLNSPEGDHHQVCVPLTFLRKGMLVNLDLKTSDGQSLPSLSFGENTWLTFAPMLKMIKALNLETVAQKLWGTPSLNWDLVFRRALLDIIQSRDQHEESLDDDYRKREQELHRRSIFGSIAEYSFWLSEADSSLWVASRISSQDPEDNRTEDLFWKKILIKLMEIPAPTGTKEDNDNQSPSASDLGWLHHLDFRNADSVYLLDSAFSVQVLAICLLKKLQELSTSSHRDCPELAVVEQLATMLSVTSISYLFATVLPREQVFTDNQPLRQLVKFGCDVEIDSFDERTAKRRLVSTNGKSTFCENIRKFIRPSKLLPKLEFEQRLLLRYSQWSASSTHLEVSTPSDIQLKDITATVSSAYTSDTELLDHSDVPKFNLRRMAVHLPSSDKSETPSESQEELNKKSYKQQREFRGSYKQALGKVHISYLPLGTHPVQLLFMNLVPDGLVGVAGAIFTSIVAMILAGFNLLWHTEGQTSSIQFEIADQIALFTLFVGIFGALFYSANKNLVARGLHRTSTRLFVYSFTVTMLATLHLCLGFWLQESNYSTAQCVWKNITWVFILPFAYFIRALFAIHKVSPLFRFLNSGNNHQENKDFYEEVFIKEDKEFPLLSDSREAIAVTETDLFDTRPYFMGKSKNADLRSQIFMHKSTVTKKALKYLSPRNQP